MVVAPGFVFLLLFGLLLYRALLHPLAKVPGPRLAGLTRLWQIHRNFHGYWHEDLVKLHEKFGSVVRIAPDEVSVVDAVATKKIYGHGQGTKKTKWYYTFQFMGQPQNIFNTIDERYHTLLRKRVSAAYSMTAILRYEQYIQSSLNTCFDKLREHGATGDTQDMNVWTGALAFDLIGELGVGQELGHLRTGKDIGSVRKTISYSIWFAARFGNLPTRTAILSHPLLSHLAGFFGVTSPFPAFLQWCTDRLHDRQNGKDGADRVDMLSYFMKMSSPVGSPPITDTDIMTEVFSLFGAGADTTSNGMRSCLYHVASHPEVYSQLQREIDRFYDANQLTEPMTYAQAQQIPYLKAVVAEALRILPPIPWPLPRYSPGIDIGAHYIPSGYTISVAAISANRDKRVFGEDANEYRPERWLATKEHFAYLEGHMMSFGGNGPRTCIGKNIALVEITKFIAQLIRNFNIELANKGKPWDVTSFFVVHPEELPMFVTPR